MRFFQALWFLIVRALARICLDAVRGTNYGYFYGETDLIQCSNPAAICKPGIV